MKILLFSDTHLTDIFDKKKFIFLKKIILSADKVIILGDFWDGYQTTFDKFINSNWKELFPVLKKKKTVYCYGNHDKKEYADKRLSLFSTIQTKQYRQKIGNRTFVFEHGDRLYQSLDMKINSRPIIRILTFIAHRILGNVFFKTGINPFKLIFKKESINIQKKIEQERKNNEFYCCGHIHEAMVKKFYANPGYIDYGNGQYLIINNGKIKLMKELYEK